MSAGEEARDPTHGYEIRVAGHLDDRWTAWFGDVTLVHESDGTTTLRTSVADQAALHGLLARVRDTGVTLISLEPSGTGRTRAPRRPLSREAARPGRDGRRPPGPDGTRGAGG